MDDRSLTKLLNRYFSQKVQLHSTEKSKALKVWEPIVRQILEQVVEKDSRFNFKTFHSGSYYERTKTKAPNEFDVMLEIESLSLGKWKPYDSHEDDLTTDPPLGFTTVMIDQGEEETWKRDRCIDRKMLNATRVKEVFSRLVHKAVRELHGHSSNVSVESHGPSVTLKFNCPGFKGSVDLTLAIKDASWPEDADDWKEKQRSWPTWQLVNQIVQDGCHLVAKRPKGQLQDADLFWRYSFSQAEKKLFNQGSSGDAGTLRKNVLRILKSLKEDLQMTPLDSYHLKNIMFYEYEARPTDSDWRDDKLAARFKSALERLKNCLVHRNCPHYFIQDLNLFDKHSFNPSRYEFLISRVDRLLHDPYSVIAKLL